MRTLAFAVLVLLSCGLHASDDVVIFGTIRQHERLAPVSNAVVELEVNEKKVLTVPVDSAGCYRLYVDLGLVAKLHYRAPGRVTKSVVVDTRKIPQAVAIGGFGMNVDLVLFLEDPTVDLSWFDGIMGRAAYRPEEQLLGWDMEFSGPLLARMAELFPRRYPAPEGTSPCAP